MSNRIHSQKIDSIKPLIWYSKPVYSKYQQIVQVLSKSFGSEMEYFLLEPDVKEEALKGESNANWYSDKFTRLKPLTKFSEKIQKKLIEELEYKIYQILELAEKLKSSENKDDTEFSEFLELVVEIPSLDYVYTNGKDITLACWGFQSIDPVDRDFRLSKVLSERLNDKKVLNVSQNENEKIKIKKKLNLKKYLLILFILLALGTLGGVGFYFKDKLFSVEKKIIPIDPRKIKIDESDPLKNKIVTNRLTIILDMDNGVTVESFKSLLQSKFPNNGLKDVYEEPLIGLIEYEVLENEKDEWIKKLKNLTEVLTVDAETIFSNKYIPNDKGFSQEKKKWFFEPIQVYKGWNQTQGSEDVVIAIIDGAFDLNHPELKNKNIVKKWNASTGTSSLSKGTADGYLHGTHVASTAVGSTDNMLGTGGICPKCSLMPIQLSQENIEGFTSNSIVRAMIYAIKNDAAVINLSIGKDYGIDFNNLSNRDKKEMRNTIRRDTLLEEIKYERIFKLAREKNIAIVYAAGNDNMFSDIDPQKRSADILVVGAINNQLEKATFSNYGENVLISSPGTDIYNASPNNSYEYLDGTSMAAPIVSGAIGLLKSINPSLPNDKLYDILIETGKKHTKNRNIGPILQIDDALKEAKKKYSCTDEVRKLKKELKKYQLDPIPRAVKKEKLRIPKKKPKDFKFAEGLWMSNEELISKNNPNIKIVLYLDIKKTGKGMLTLKLNQNNEKCKANISLSFNENILNITQLEIASCNQSNRAYNKYFFSCIASTNNIAICNAKGNNEVTFELIKVEK